MNSIRNNLMRTGSFRFVHVRQSSAGVPVWKKSYTLVELLITMGIIIILMSLLFPSLKSAKEKTHDIACRSNLKQMMLGYMSYPCDYNDWLLCANLSLSSGYPWYKAMYDLNYLPVKNVFKCPSEPIFDYSLSTKMNYGMNLVIGFRPTTECTWPAQKMSAIARFNHNSTLLVLADSTPLDYAGELFGGDSAAFVSYGACYPVTTTGTPKYAYPTYARHNLRVNAGIFDGHAEGIASLWTKRNIYWNPYIGSTKQLTEW